MAPTLPPPPRLAKTTPRRLKAWRNLHPHLKGRIGELIALCYLLAHGYHPAPRPFRAIAQTDLLLQKGHLLVLVEVKARSSAERAHFALHPHQKKRLFRQMNALAARHPHLTLRIDLILLYPHAPFLTHLKNI